MSGYGELPYGGDPYGDGSADAAVEGFDLIEVNPVDYRTIDLRFSADLSEDTSSIAVIGSLGSYAITRSLQVVAAALIAPSTIRVFTFPQNPGATYEISVSSLLKDTDQDPIDNRVGSWVALEDPKKYVVTDLDARSECVGKAIFLSWILPEGAAHVKVVRRLKAWPFDLTDGHDVVYDGGPISSLTDTGIVTPSATLTAGTAGTATIPVSASAGFSVGDDIRIENLDGPQTYDILTIGSIPNGTSITLTSPLTGSYESKARVSKSSPLQAQTYYYYLVLVSKDEGPDYTYDISDDSRAFALSIAEFGGASWFTNQTTRYDLVLDAKPAEEGGGDGFLGKWLQVAGCWLNLMRGHLNALSLTNDPDQTPFHTLTAKNQSLGIDPEGFAFDFDIVRRPLTALAFVYKRRGTCPGVLETVSMFTKWDAQCVEFGLGGCAGGTATLKTWDGQSAIARLTETSTHGFDMLVTSPKGDGVFTFPGQTWADDLWLDATIRGRLGDVACVDTNVSNNQVLTKAPRVMATLRGAFNPGTLEVQVDTTVAFRPGMTVQITSSGETIEGSGEYLSEIFEIYDVHQPGNSGAFHVRAPSLQVAGYPAGSIVTIGKSIVQREYYAGASTATGQVVTEARAKWVENQWKGLVALCSDNQKRHVVSNTGTTMTLDGTAPPAGAFAISTDFDLGATFADRTPYLDLRLMGGEHSTLFDATLDLEARGTVYDPSNRLYNGTGLALSGVYGPSDTAVLITTPVAVGQGWAQSVAGFTFQLDPSQPAPAADEWKGLFLNPNQNQDQMFEILTNTTTSLIIAGNTSSIVQTGQRYYVLAPRDKVRFDRLTKRLRTEFTDMDTNIRVLFS